MAYMPEKEGVIFMRYFKNLAFALVFAGIVLLSACGSYSSELRRVEPIDPSPAQYVTWIAPTEERIKQTRYVIEGHIDNVKEYEHSYVENQGEEKLDRKCYYSLCEVTVSEVYFSADGAEEIKSGDKISYVTTISSRLHAEESIYPLEGRDLMIFLMPTAYDQREDGREELSELMPVHGITHAAVIEGNAVFCYEFAKYVSSENPAEKLDRSAFDALLDTYIEETFVKA